jgi:hypothetical protein
MASHAANAAAAIVIALLSCTIRRTLSPAEPDKERILPEKYRE